jgi:hypothetical protein
MTRRQKTKILLIAIPVLIAALIFIFIKQMNSPAVGTINQPDTKAAAANQQPAAPLRYGGRYISFAVPAGYQKIPSEKVSGTQVELAQYYSTRHLSRRLSVGVQREALADESGYLLRTRQPQTYGKISSSPPVFSKSTAEESEIVAFISHGELLASIAITAPGQQDLKADYDSIVSSLSWK